MTLSYTARSGAFTCGLASPALARRRIRRRRGGSGRGLKASSGARRRDGSMTSNPCRNRWTERMTLSYTARSGAFTCGLSSPALARRRIRRRRGGSGRGSTGPRSSRRAIGRTSATICLIRLSPGHDFPKVSDQSSPPGTRPRRSPRRGKFPLMPWRCQPTPFLPGRDEISRCSGMSWCRWHQTAISASARTCSLVHAGTLLPLHSGKGPPLSWVSTLIASWFPFKTAEERRSVLTYCSTLPSATT
jgi:hypothetical protein